MERRMMHCISGLCGEREAFSPSKAKRIVSPAPYTTNHNIQNMKVSQNVYFIILRIHILTDVYYTMSLGCILVKPVTNQLYWYGQLICNRQDWSAGLVTWFDIYHTLSSILVANFDHFWLLLLKLASFQKHDMQKYH